MTNVSDKVHILLCGYYFQGNTGDDIMMEAIVKSLSKYGEVKVTSSFNTDEIDWCDILLIGGGTHIRPWNIGGYEHAKYAKEKGKKIVYYAQTIEDGHPLFEEHLNRADFITVRDSESKRVVERHGFRAILTSDPVFVKRRRIIGFSLRKWLTEPPGFIERFASVLDDLSKDYDIVSIPYTLDKTDTESDLSYHDKIIKLMKYELSHKSYDEIIDSIDLLISMRLHAIITAVNVGKKVLAIDYDSKVGRILSDLELKDMVVSYNDVEKITDIVRNKIFRVDSLAQREKINEALIAKICADIRGEPSPKISVVMYTRNRSGYFKKAIDSIIDQTMQDWELIIIDDGSTDDTREQVQSYNDKRIKYYNFGYNGMGFSRNIGNLLSRGEIILVADSDYVNLPNRLEVTCNEMEQNGADIIYCSMFYLNPDREKKIMSSQSFSYEKLRESNFLYHPTVAYRREVALKCPYNENSEVLEDYHMYLQAADMGYKFHYIKEPLVMHQLNDGQPLSSQSSEILEAEKVVGTSCKHDTSMVSIIIPTCDRPGFLREALQSVISQTYKNFEVIVINDGGEDVLEIINSLDNKGNIIYLRHEERRGPSAARNTGLKVARGKYIAYLDDDDIYYPNHLETLIVFLERSNYKVAYTDSYQAFQTWITDRYVTTDKKITYSHDFDRNRFLICNYIHLGNICHRRELLDEVGLFDEELETHEDWDLCIRLSQRYDFFHIKTVTAEFRTRDDMSSATSIKRADFLRTLKLIHKRYSHLVTDDKIVKDQKMIEWALAKEVVNRPQKSVLENSYLIDIAETLIQQKDVHIGNLEATVREKDVHIGNLETHTRNLEAMVRDKDTHIANFEAMVKDKDTHIRNLEVAIGDKDATLNHIYNSHGWKALLIYYRLRDKILPVDSRRRVFAKIVFNAILNPRGILKNLNRKNLKKFVHHFKASDLSVLEEKIERKLTQESQYEQYLQSLEKSEDSEDIKRQKAAAFQYRPKISIIVPVYNTDEKWLRLCIESVINQIYDNWELCITDGGSTKSYIRKILEGYAVQDSRIRVKFLTENKGIAGNSNEALSLATGEFLTFLDHDDILTLNALYEVAKAINGNPYVDFIYSDEIMIDSTGNVIHIAFRPDFSEYYYLSHPYIVHLCVFRKSLIDKIGGFNEKDFNSNVSHDVDLILRVIANTKPDKIMHVPKPLYKWRISGRSAGHIYKDKVHEFTKKAIKMFLDRKVADGYVEDGMHFNTFRVRFNLKERKKVSIIIPTKDNHTLLKQAIRSIEEKTDYKNYEILIVCNNTTDDAAKTFIRSLKKDNKYKILEFNKPFNYSAINNFAVSHAEGEYLLFLNDDIEVINPDWLTSMVEIAQDPRVGVVGAKLLYPDSHIQHAGVVLGLMNGIAEHTHKFIYAYTDKNKMIYEPGYEGSLVCIREYSAVTGACMLTKRHVFSECGGMTEELKYGYNDIDFCLKVREQGYLVLFTPYAILYHHESASRRVESSDTLFHPGDSETFYKKWKELIQKCDRYYNPNLSLNSYIPIPKR